MPKVIHFELGADDTQRAGLFYQKVFGWQIHRSEGIDYSTVVTGDASEPGIDGAIIKRADPSMGVINSINVRSVDQCVALVTQNGGQVVAPKVAIPGVGYMAYCVDTEGNVFSLIQPDPSARTTAEPIVPPRTTIR